MRTLEEITRLIEVYPPEWRRWCDAPERDGCACMGCVRHPAPSTVPGDPEYYDFPNPGDRLTKAEVEMYREAHGIVEPPPVFEWSSFELLPDGRMGQQTEEGRTVFLPDGSQFTTRVTRAQIEQEQVGEREEGR